jgi:hypothetical protein
MMYDRGFHGTNDVNRARLLPVLFSTLVLAAAASAQYPGGAGGTGGTGGAGGRGGMGGMGGTRSAPPQDGMRRGPPAEAPLSPGAMVQVQLDQLEDDLRMTPAQLAAWRIYADKVQKLADDTARSRLDARAATAAPANAVQQLEQIAGGARGRATSIDEIVAAGRTLYATLNDEQKVIADRRLWLSVSLLATGVVPPGMSDAAGRPGRRPPQ